MPLPRVNFSNVNITIQQFQEIASGKYNAGEVRLATATSLDKINHRVTFKGDNKVSLSHAEVLAVKQAFVRALSGAGVGADEVARVRAQLGLDPKRPVDVELKERSLKPLSRQQIRTILDRNANAINEHVGEGTIRSHAQIWGDRYTEEERASFARTRRQVNAALVNSRATVADRGVQDDQALLAGDVLFRSPADRERLIAEARRMKQTILDGSGGNPRTEPGATLRVTRPNGAFDVTFSLGGSERDAIRRLDDELLLMRSPREPSPAELAVRREFRTLPADLPSRQEWVRNLAADPQCGFKARAVAVGMLLQLGVSDWETLSRVNRIPDGAAYALLSNLVNQAGSLRDDALRQSPAVANLANQIEPGPRPPESQVYIPALSPDELMSAAMDGLNGNAARSTYEMNAVRDRVLATLRARFGAGVLPANVQLVGLANVPAIQNALGNGTVRRSIEEMADGLVEVMARGTARVFLQGVLKPIVKAAGGPAGLATVVATHVMKRHTDLRDRLAAAQTPEAANAIIQEFRPQLEAAVRRQLSVERLRAAAVDDYRSHLADALGVPVSSLAGGAVNVRRLQTLGERLATAIGEGVNPADSDAEIELAYRTLANDLANERIGLLHQADALDVAPEARDTIKDIVLRVGKVTGLNLAALQQAAAGVPVAALANAFAAGKTKDDVLRQMGAVGTAVRNATLAAIGGQDGMLDEVNDAAGIVLVLALAKRPEIFHHLRTFFSRDDVTNQDLSAVAGPAANAGAFLVIKPDESAAESNAALADAIGSPRLAPIPAHALYRELDALGFDDLSRADKAALLAGPDGQVLAQQIRDAGMAVTPVQLRRLARMSFAQSAARHVLERHLVTFASDNHVDVSGGVQAAAADILFRRDPELLDRLAADVSRAAVRGEDPVAVAAGLLANESAAALAVVRSLAVLRDAEADARETAVGEIALQATLDEAVVRERLDAAPLAESLAALRTAVVDELANPATNLANWDADNVNVRANGCVESFLRDKAAFLAEVFELPVPADVRGALVVSALENPACAGREVPAAASQLLQRDDVRATFDYARGILTADAVAQMTDADLFSVLQAIGARLDTAMEALPPAQRDAMGEGGRAILLSILSAALAGHCGDTLVAAAARLAAAGRLDSIDAHAAAAAHAHPAVPTARRLLAEVRTALRDAWLPAPLAEALRTGAATAVQKAIAEALERRAPDLVARIGAGLDPEKAARLKAFALTLDYRDHALATAEKTLRDAADALRAAPDAAQAEARLAALAGTVFSPRDAAAFVAAAAARMKIDPPLDEAKAALAAELLSEFAGGLPVLHARLIANFIVHLDLTARSAALDRRRVELFAPQIAAWREFKLEDPGKEQVCEFLKTEANDLILYYEKPANKAQQYENDLAKAMQPDIHRGYYTIAGKRFTRRPAAEVLEAFGQAVATPKAKRALSILMSQASSLAVLAIQMKDTAAPNDLRPQPLDVSTLPGAGEFVSRSCNADPELFFSRQFVDDNTSIYDLSVSEDGATATLKIVKSAKMAVGTEDYNVKTHFGSVVVEEEVTVDLTAEVPTVTNVRVAQRFDDSEPVPAPQAPAPQV